ncbi:MAG: endonuclease MutS2 [Deltaproteobacteria bacterium]|nr:endonuclease MutS2 [Deltaproteobacteria bacterium]
MSERTLRVLGFHRILELLAEGAESPQGTDVCLSLRPAPGLSAAQRLLDEVGELLRLEPTLGLPRLAGLHRVEPVLDTARVAGACLDAEAFLAVRETIAACQRLLEYLEDASSESQGSPVGGYAEEMAPHLDLIDRFERTFGPGGEILDGASPTLSAIRAEIKRVRDKVLKTLEAVLRSHELEPAVQDDFITSRDGRYVVPLKTDFRGFLKGIVHDRSRSGATFFVEPLETVELNNQLTELKQEEAEEIRRILVELTRAVGAEAGRIRANLAVAAHLDSIAARARLARRMRANRPELRTGPGLDLRAAKHPLLDLQLGDATVPIDVRLGEETRLLLITGANAGGKTVALKTTGLLVLMAQSGLYVPAGEGTWVGWFDRLFADIGDDQDVERNLSTFSAHIAYLRDILEAAEEGSLVLLDELGTGTDPAEGSALAMAILDELLECRASVVATTHLAGLKVFAFSKAGAQNAAVAFDPATGRPLYRLEYGRAGASNALEVAERLGFPASVLARARAYGVPGSDASAELLARIEEAREIALREAKEAEALRRRWEEGIQAQHRLVDEARRERDVAREEARREARGLLEETRRELAAVIRSFADRQLSQRRAEEAVGAAARRLDEELRDETTPSVPDASVLSRLQPGSRVVVVSLGKEGSLEFLHADGEKATVRIGGLRMTIPVRDLAGTASVRPPVSGPPKVSARPEPFAGEVVVVGLSVEDALDRVDKALDRALLGGANGFRVIHGRGTGALRRAIREHLAEDPHVAAVRPVEGNDAVTWVDLS